MNKSYDQGREDIARLAKRFAANREAYHSPDYKEAHVRMEYIDPLFMALGWDVRNDAGAAPQYREVIPEPALDAEGQVKAPDYAFRIGASRKFFAEAKKPGANIEVDVAPAYQVRRYGWTAKLPLSILTDFEELAVYDCRVRPSPKDKASKARLSYWGFEQYPDHWREVWDLFSREAVISGAFDRFAEGTGTRRGASTVDAEFLKEIEGWRDLLAHNIANRNSVEAGDLNDSVQRTIDRIIFLRMAEDRGMEEQNLLLKLLDREDVYTRLLKLFGKAEARYNSGLFDFEADRLTPKLKVDDKVLAAIIKSLYYPQCPYAFNLLPADILGNVYEQFLGKVIRVTDGGRAKVEDKPEVKKAGGVYYTPSYIVDYIVRNTVGKQVEGKGPKQLRGFRVLDMACGSGSFLLGAYQHLLDHHLRWYTNNGPEKNDDAMRQAAGAAGQPEWRLTIAEKKRILTEHVFGVDIDRQAVEVTKLSLLLKVLEGETDETVGQQMQLFHERALPNLDNNIKCGNSLIGPDYFAGRLLPDQEEMQRINPFDWKAGFSEAARAGGFDCVIGNPPYVRIQNMQEWAPREVEIYKELYRSAAAGNYDIYVVFVEKGLGLLKAGGGLGFILPHKFFNAQYGEALRKCLAEGRHLAEVVHFGDQQVFQGATTYTCLMFLTKAGATACSFAKVTDLKAWRAAGKAEAGAIPAEKIGAAEWNFAVGPSAGLFEKLSGMPVKLGQLAARIAQGIRTSANEVYVLDQVSVKGNLVTAKSKQLGKDVVVERGAVRLFLQGREIKPYSIAPSGKLVIIPYRSEGDRMVLVTKKELGKEYPKALAYLRKNQTYLESREHGRMRRDGWYAYVYPKNLDVMAAAKILIPDIADRASFALDEGGEYAFTSGYGITLKPDVREAMKYVLGLLNSKVLDFYLKRVSTTMRGGYFRYFTQFVEQLPIRPIDFTKPTEKTAHDRMVSLVEQMLELHKQLAGCRGESSKLATERLIASTDAEIDRLVCDLYELTEDEIKIVDGGMGGHQ